MYTEIEENAKNDILNSLDLFNDDELILEQQNNAPFIVFVSIEFYQILYVTNEGLYYLDNETKEALKDADLIKDTKDGKIFCFS